MGEQRLIRCLATFEGFKKIGVRGNSRPCIERRSPLKRSGFLLSNTFLQARELPPALEKLVVGFDRV